MNCAMFSWKRKTLNRRDNKKLMLSLVDIQHIAKLARIELTEQEQKAFQADLSSILDYFEILRKVTVEQQSGDAYSLGMENVFRKDQALPKKEKDGRFLLAMAPLHTPEGYLRVQSIM